MPEPQYVRLDVFPATVTSSEGSTLQAVKAVVSQDTLYVFKDSVPTPVLVLEVPLYSFESTARNSYTAVSDDDGTVYSIAKQVGCGCGNKLKGFRAFPGVPRTKL